MNNEYYILHEDGQEEGPYTQAQIDAIFNQARITLNTRIRGYGGETATVREIIEAVKMDETKAVHREKMTKLKWILGSIVGLILFFILFGFGAVLLRDLGN